MMYKLSNSTTIIRIADCADIPNDPANRDYVEYITWVEAGNAPEPADPVPEPTPAPTLVEQILASPTDLAALKQALGP